MAARQVGARLGYRVVERELINQAALRTGKPEVALAMIDDLKLLGLSPSAEAFQAYCEAVTNVMEELAAEGNVVIVGRAGQVILAGRPDVLHVLTIAPLDVRARRIAERHGVAIHQAKAQVEASDRTRRLYLKRFYHIRWDDPALYNLVINTADFTLEATAELIIQAFLQRFPPSNQ
jgi:cytidylate kinase